MKRIIPFIVCLLMVGCSPKKTDPTTENGTPASLTKGTIAIVGGTKITVKEFNELYENKEISGEGIKDILKFLSKNIVKGAKKVGRFTSNPKNIFDTLDVVADIATAAQQIKSNPSSAFNPKNIDSLLKTVKLGKTFSASGLNSKSKKT